MPLQEFPDGSDALFRDGEEYCEIVSDPVASRTIWYYMDEDKFIASMLQRAIIMFIGSFEFDERVMPWITSSVKRMLPSFIKNTLRDKVTLPSVDNNVLAFRLFLISKMNKILNDDCNMTAK